MEKLIVLILSLLCVLNSAPVLAASNVGANTEVKGAIIASGSYDEQGNFIDTGNLVLNTGSLNYSDIDDFYTSDGKGFGLSTSIGGSKTDKQDASLHPQGQTTLTVKSTGYESEQETRATIGQGSITVGGDSNPNLADLNRDVNNAQEIMKDVITRALDSDMAVDNRIFTEEGWNSILKDHHTVIAAFDVLFEEILKGNWTKEDIDKVQKEVEQKKAEMEQSYTVYETTDNIYMAFAALAQVSEELKELVKLGVLSQEYEVGKGGAGTTNMDNLPRTEDGNYTCPKSDPGGCSYGSWQIAASTGTMDEFMEYVKKADPESYKELQTAGGAEAARRGEAAFVDTWKAIAANNPDFETVQRGFIKEQKYDPLVKAIEQNNPNFELDKYGLSVAQVIWSIAVQHGENSTIVQKALNKINLETATAADVINALYDERTTSILNLNKLSEKTKKAVLNRYEKERKDALRGLQ